MRGDDAGVAPLCSQSPQTRFINLSAIVAAGLTIYVIPVISSVRLFSAHTPSLKGFT